MKRVLVTGGTGFLARHLVRRLDEAGCEAWSLSRSSLGGRSIQADLTRPEDLARSLAGRTFDCIIHSAAHIPEPEGKADLQRCQEANFDGTYNLLRFAAEAGVGTFVQVSSLAMFDPCQQQGITEETTPCPRTDYANSKLAAEYLCRAFAREHGMTIPVLRVGTIYGPGMNDGRMINFFIQKCLGDEDFEVYNSQLVLNTVHVDDVVQVLRTLMLWGESALYHLVTGSETKEALVRRIAACLGSRSQVTFRDGPPMPGNTFETAKVRALLEDGGESFVRLEEGVRRYVQETTSRRVES